MNKMEDQNLLELVRKSKNGDPQALEKLVASCQPSAFRLALSILDDPAEADDVTQEAFVKAVRGISAYREEASFNTWLYRIIVNSCLGRLRKKRARQRLNQLLFDRLRDASQEDAPVEKHAMQDENSARVMQAVSSLDDDHRLPVLLRYYHELPIAEIAEMLSVSPRTVHTRLQQAHERMRKVLGEYDGND
jgi:RNA polymerase sigma-70 factor (ECF subfamily)